MTKTEALQQRRKLLKLVEHWTRAEIIARLGRFDNLGYLDYEQVRVDKIDEIRELVFGTSDILVLGDMWGLIKPKRHRKKKKKRSSKNA